MKTFETNLQIHVWVNTTKFQKSGHRIVEICRETFNSRPINSRTKAYTTTYNEIWLETTYRTIIEDQKQDVSGKCSLYPNFSSFGIRWGRSQSEPGPIIGLKGKKGGKTGLISCYWKIIVWKVPSMYRTDTSMGRSEKCLQTPRMTGLFNVVSWF